MVQATQTRGQAASPERWARALDRALHAGVEVFVTQGGESYATSTSRHDLLHRVTATSCDCEAARAGDPICCHRAALRSIKGLLEVATVPLADLFPNGAPRCGTCAGAGEYLAGCPLDSHNPSRLVTCVVCSGTGRDLERIARAA